MPLISPLVFWENHNFRETMRQRHDHLDSSKVYIIDFTVMFALLRSTLSTLSLVSHDRIVPL